jgi:NAD-dependent dihydropyrimidine dehydrogenase PreA subunit
MLGSLKKQPVPAAAVKSNYFAAVETDECTGCETCLDRCQMEAITIEDDTAAIDLDRCIGCGLCVTTCPTEAAQLVKKTENEQYFSLISMESLGSRSLTW